MHKRISVAFVLGASIVPATTFSSTEKPDVSTMAPAPRGFSVGNFGIAAVTSADGLGIAKSLINPPTLGQWLKPFGDGELQIVINGRRDLTLRTRSVIYPVSAESLESPSSGVMLDVRTFAPIKMARSLQNSLNNFLPAIIVQLTLQNRTEIARTAQLSYEWRPADPFDRIDSGTIDYEGHRIGEMHGEQGGRSVWLLSASDDVRWRPHPDLGAAGSAASSLVTRTQVTLAPHSQRSISYVIGAFDPEALPATRYPSRLTLERYLLSQGVLSSSGKSLRFSLASDLDQFVASLPRIGVAALDEYLRWYLSAAILLTKGTSKNEILTMGYRELNQRDSFWASGAHLIFWPALELKMLEECMTSQLPSGQIPLTILPVIERDNNVDGTEYFVLRIARYARWYRDAGFIARALPHVRQAIEYLKSLDHDYIGIPRQMSYWADWKDVPGVEGRTYAPHFDLLWLATLKEAGFLARAGHDEALTLHLEELFRVANERINRDVHEGGLWDAPRYVDRWADGREVRYTLEDQTVGAVFGVIPKERLEQIYATLNQSNESHYGVRETYPYIAGFSQGDYGAAEYHNGGIWPYLNFVDAWGRFLNGHAVDAERILNEVGSANLVESAAYSPSEFMNGETGKNSGFQIQGWDADFFSAIFFGALGLERLDENTLALCPHLPDERDIESIVHTPVGNVRVERRSGQISIVPERIGPLRIVEAPRCNGGVSLHPTAIRLFSGAAAISR